MLVVGSFGDHWLWRGIGGTWLDARPAVVDFFEAALRRDREVLVVLRDGAPVANPPSDLTLRNGDRLLALGTRDSLERLEKLIAAG